MKDHKHLIKGYVRDFRDYHDLATKMAKEDMSTVSPRRLWFLRQKLARSCAQLKVFFKAEEASQIFFNVSEAGIYVIMPKDTAERIPPVLFEVLTVLIVEEEEHVHG